MSGRPKSDFGDWELSEVGEEIIMTNLLVFREQLKKFYSKYELYLTPVFKFFSGTGDVGDDQQQYRLYE